MKKFFMLILCMNIIYFSAYTQGKYKLSGVIIDENKTALTGASIYIFPLKKGTVTNTQGEYTIAGLEKGKYLLEIAFIGFKTLSDTIFISEDMEYNAGLSLSPLSLQEISVTSNYAETRKNEESLNIEIVNDVFLKQHLGGSLTASIERLPGVTSMDIGSGQSKPVIRGLGFNRVVVVENGVKHEGQEWGADHGLEIDQFSLDNIEVIKGPASIMYGSDAIGGVIDVKENHMAAENTLNGSVDLLAKSNNNLMGTSVSISGRKKAFFADLRATALDYGDYKVPTDSVNIYSFRAPLYNNQLRNTAGKEKNLHLSFGYAKENFQSRFYLSDVNSKSGFFANTHGLEPRNVDTGLHDKSSRDILYPYQQVNHLKIINKSQWQWDKFKLETALGYQQNFRQEWSQYVNHGYMPAIFPEYLDFDGDLERQFDKQTYSGNLKLSYNPNDKTLFIIGLNVEYQDNRIDGRGFIIPAFKEQNEGAYLFSRHKFSKQSMIQMAVRYDNGHINTQQYKDWFPSPLINGTDTSYQYLERAADLDLNFSNVSFSVGYNFNPGKWSYKANIGKSFRMPIAKELAANGVNYHHFSYEVGNPDLSPEISYQFDAGMEYNSKKLAIGLTPFLNYFSNYIYLNPGYEHDRLYGNGNQVYYYTESEVLRYGGELHAHYHVLAALQLGIIGEYVYSRQLSGLKKGFTLPFSPPASAIFNVKYNKLRYRSVNNAYLSIDYRITSSQNNIVPPEETTEGYQLVNIGLGGELHLKHQELRLSMQIQNLFNKKYFNHTSYYRLINVPEPGRNFILNISIPIKIAKNKQDIY